MVNYSAFACKTIGVDHIRRNVCCQDAVAKYNDDTMSSAVVSDGHGSPQYFRSDFGAEIAVQAALDCVKAFVSKVELGEGDGELSNKISLKDLIDKRRCHDLLKGLQKSILIKWHEKVDEHYSSNPFDDDVLSSLPDKYQKRYRTGDIYGAYGATLIATVVTEKFWFGLHMGDGHCVVVNKDYTITHPIPWDENCHDEVTTSICQNDAIDNFRYYFDTEIPYAIYIGSDGVDDSYDNDEMLDSLYRGISIVFGQSFDVGVSEVDEYIKVITQKGKGDDTSIAGIIDLENISDCSEIFMKKVQLDKVREQFESSEALYERIKTQLEFETKRLEELKSKKECYDQQYSESVPEYKKISSLLGIISSKIEELEKNIQTVSQTISEQEAKILQIEGRLAEAKAKMEADSLKYREELIKYESKSEDDLHKTDDIHLDAFKEDGQEDLDISESEDNNSNSNEE